MHDSFHRKLIFWPKEYNIFGVTQSMHVLLALNICLLTFMASNVNMNTASSGDTFKGIHRITSKFTWDKKVVLWEIQNISEAVGRRNLLGDTSSSSLNDSSHSHEIQEFQSLLDIDYINSTHFDAGTHPENKSSWSLSVYKQTNPEYLGLFLHLLEIDSESAVNRRFRRNRSFDEFDNNSLYMKYTMSILSATGSVLHKIENPTIISIMGGNSWGEEQFLRLDLLWDPNSRFLADDTLRIQVDLYLFHQLTHTVNEREGPAYWERCQAKVSTLSGGSDKLLESLWTNRMCSDVNIECGDRVFPVHKCIISVASPVFEAMFLSDMEEASQNKVTINDTDPAVLEVMLEYVYTGKVSENWHWDDLNGVSQLLNACEKYQIKLLKEFCLKMVCDQIDVSNAGEIAILVHLYNAEEFAKNYVYKFITTNIKTLRQRPSFVQLLNLNPGAFMPILLSDAICDLQRPV